MTPPDTPRIESIQRSLLTWFDRSQRELPWRRTRDPYGVWISEIMCQQTQVATVVPYWERFVARFPDVHALAQAPVDDVLALWSGLGYYARARNLHRAAQALVERHAGEFPRDLDALLSLPGFGPYTAGAVGSIALGLDAPLVDGNVARVLCRLEGWEVGAERAREQAWSEAERWLARGRAGDWNQALMELGATVCTPQAPRCETCPVRSTCVASARGDPARHPLPKVRRARKRLRVAALCVRDADAVLLLKRPESGLFGGLWELPGEVVPDDGDTLQAARESARQLSPDAEVTERVGRVEQTLTHRDVEVDVFAVRGEVRTLPEGARWVQPESLTTLGLSTLAVRVLQAAGVPVPEGHGRRRARKSSQEQGRLF